MSKKITVSISQSIKYCDDISGNKIYVPDGRTNITVTCPEISDEPIDVRNIRTAPIALPDKVDVLSALIKQYPHMENLPVDDEKGLISLKDLYFHLLPELNKEKERKAYESNVEKFLNGKD